MNTAAHDRFMKAEDAARKADAEVKRAYAIWCDACERLKRIENERLDAWCDLVAGTENEVRTIAPENASRTY